jgi:ABC-type sulfate/molybdate transport systems ATPase subunit
MARLSIENASVGSVLRGVSLVLESGELACVLARRRAARLALLRVAAGVDRPDSGRSVADGRVILAQGRWPAVGGSTVLDQMTLAVLASRGSMLRARSVALAGLAEWGVEDWCSCDLGEFEDFELAKLAVVRALIAAPEILLIDDPTCGLEAVYANGVLDLLRAARDRNIAVLVTTASVDAMRDADSLHTISQGILRGANREPAEVVPFPRRRAR